MSPSGIAEGNKLFAQAVQVLSILRHEKIDLVVPDSPNEVFNVGVIGGTAFPVYGDTDRLQVLDILDVLPVNCAHGSL